MSGFIAVAKTSDLTSSGKLCLEVEDRYIVIVKIADQYFCIDDVCTHDGGPLGEGELDGFCLTCPRHGAQFDVRTGAAVTMPATEPSVCHEVRVEGEHILVKLHE